MFCESIFRNSNEFSELSNLWRTRTRRGPAAGRMSIKRSLDHYQNTRAPWYFGIPAVCSCSIWLLLEIANEFDRGTFRKYRIEYKKRYDILQRKLKRNFPNKYFKNNEKPRTLLSSPVKINCSSNGVNNPRLSNAIFPVSACKNKYSSQERFISEDYVCFGYSES